MVLYDNLNINVKTTNIMKKFILFAALAAMSFAANAQDLKFGYVDFNEVVMLMPDMDQARATIAENQKIQEENLVAIYEEYQIKVQQYEQKQATWTPAVRESKEKEIMDIQARFEQNQQAYQAELQQLQQTLQAPIVEKAANKVNELAKAKGLVAVFEEASLLYIDPVQMIDLTPEVRAALNIPEERTLETLQAELMAAAQVQ